MERSAVWRAARAVRARTEEEGQATVQGHGSQASTIIVKNINKKYDLYELDDFFGSREKAERVIENYFKRDEVIFNWDDWELYVGGTYTEIWD